MLLPKKVCGIYKITNPNGRIYIGQSIDCFSRRRKYSRLQCYGQSRLFNSINKYGWERHEFEIIHRCMPAELNELEQYYIQLYQTFNTEHGLNLQEGGAGTLSEESRKKISIANTGRSLPEETKRKISRTLSGRKEPLEVRLKKSKSRIGLKHSEKTKEKMSLSLRGNQRWLGKKHTTEAKSKISKAGLNKRKVVQLSLTNTFIQIWESISIAATSLGGRQNGIIGSCKNRYKTSNGYKWMYLDDYLLTTKNKTHHANGL